MDQILIYLHRLLA
jgi:hypothetical protein